MADLYRKSSLEKLSNPEQLDRAITISSPMSWLALIGVGLIIAATVVWSVFGSLPTTVNVEGLVVSPASVGAQFSEQAGVVKKVCVKLGDELNVGTAIAVVRLSSGKDYTIKSTVEGRVSEILVSVDGVKEAAMVFPGTEIIRYTPKTNGNQVVVCYVPLAEAQQYREGMEVFVSLASAASQNYGHMSAKVIGVGDYPVSAQNLAFVGGTDENSLAGQLMAKGPIVSLICELEPDSSTASGYKWSGKKGESLKVKNGSLVSAQIVTERVAPITKLISGLKDKMEGNK